MNDNETDPSAKDRHREYTTVLDKECERLRKELERMRILQVGWRNAWIAVVHPGPSDLRYADEQVGKSTGEEAPDLVSVMDIREQLVKTWTEKNTLQERVDQLEQQDAVREERLASCRAQNGDLMKQRDEERAMRAAIADSFAPVTAEMMAARTEADQLRKGLEQARAWNNQPHGVGASLAEIIDRALETPKASSPALQDIDIVFDGPPGPVSGRFVEVEDQEGHSIRVGEWVHRDDGYWALRIRCRGPVT